MHTAEWLPRIANYHAVYAIQDRHPVEVSAEESDHIGTWFGNTMGAAFAVPGLTDFRLTFEGGRPLAAKGKPVAQLICHDVEGVVIAHCLQPSNRDAIHYADGQRIRLRVSDCRWRR